MVFLSVGCGTSANALFTLSVILQIITENGAAVSHHSKTVQDRYHQRTFPPPSFLEWLKPETSPPRSDPDTSDPNASSTRSDAEGSSVWPDPKTPPTWPKTFQVQFQETIKLGLVTASTNNGTWYYDFGNLTARFDHGRGQLDNFCQGQGLSPKDPSADCQLLFTRSGDMWVIYPGAQSCCRLCGAAQGCTILKPDWLTGASLLETITIEGRPCAGWAKKGAVAAADTWYSDEKGVPCRYHEVVSNFSHNLTFVPGTFSTLPVPASIFQVPSYCQSTCPHPYKPPHGFASLSVRDETLLPGV